MRKEKAVVVMGIISSLPFSSTAVSFHSFPQNNIALWELGKTTATKCILSTVMNDTEEKCKLCLLKWTERAAFIEMSVMQTHQRWIRSLRKLKTFLPSHSALSFSINPFRDESVHRDCLHFILIMLKEFPFFITQKKGVAKFKSCIFHTNHSQKIYLEFFIFQPIKVISLNVCLACVRTKLKTLHVCSSNVNLMLAKA